MIRAMPMVGLPLWRNWCGVRIAGMVLKTMRMRIYATIHVVVLLASLEVTISVHTGKGEPTMDVRGKLAELLCEVQYLGGLEEKIADHLIANGVTVQGDKDTNVPSKWISVKDRLPEPFVDVIAFFGGQEMNVDCVDNNGRWYSSYMDRDDPTHWMPMPQPPKGE
jgi:hypothetical protein